MYILGLWTHFDLYHSSTLFFLLQSCVLVYVAVTDRKRTLIIPFLIGLIKLDLLLVYLLQFQAQIWYTFSR